MDAVRRNSDGTPAIEGALGDALGDALGGALGDALGMLGWVGRAGLGDALGMLWEMPWGMSRGRSDLVRTKKNAFRQREMAFYL